MPLYFPRALTLLAATAWLSAFCASDWLERKSVIAAFLFAIVVCSLKRKLPWKFALCLLQIAALFIVYALTAKPHAGNLDLSQFNSRSVIFEARLIDNPKSFGSLSSICAIEPLKMVFPRSAHLQGKAQLVFHDKKMVTFKRGDCLAIKASLRAPENPVEPWKFQTGDFLARQSLFSIATTEGECWRVEHAPRSIASQFVDSALDFADNRRAAVLAVHQKNIGPALGALLQSIVLGDKTTELSHETKSAFRQVGLSHITAASGFNLTVVVGISYWITRFIGKLSLLRRAVPLAAICLFILLAGPSASVVRAALCCAIFLMSAQTRRRFNHLAVLSLSTIATLAFDPTAATDVGAELSYGATFGILCLVSHNRQTASAAGKGRLEPIFNSLRVLLFDSLSVLFSVQLLVLPIQLTYFWQSGWAFLPANLIVEPVVAPLTMIGFVSSALIIFAPEPLSPLAQTVSFWLDQCASVLIRFILFFVDYFNKFPNAVTNFGPPSFQQTALYYVSVFVFLHFLKARKHVLLASLALLFALANLLFRSPLKQPILYVTRDAFGIVGTDRHGFFMGDGEQAEKFAAFYGATVTTIQDPQILSSFGDSQAKTLKITSANIPTVWAFGSSKVIKSPFAVSNIRESWIEEGIDRSFQFRVRPCWRIRHDRKIEQTNVPPFTLYLGSRLEANLDQH